MRCSSPTSVTYLFHLKHKEANRCDHARQARGEIHKGVALARAEAGMQLVSPSDPLRIAASVFAACLTLPGKSRIVLTPTYIGGTRSDETTPRTSVRPDQKQNTKLDTAKRLTVAHISRNPLARIARSRMSWGQTPNPRRA